MILAKKYAGLVAGGASWSAIARSVHQIGPVGSLTAMTLQAGTDKIYAEPIRGRRITDSACWH